MMSSLSNSAAAGDSGPSDRPEPAVSCSHCRSAAIQCHDIVAICDTEQHKIIRTLTATNRLREARHSAGGVEPGEASRREADVHLPAVGTRVQPRGKRKLL